MNRKYKYHTFKISEAVNFYFEKCLKNKGWIPEKQNIEKDYVMVKKLKFKKSDN